MLHFDKVLEALTVEIDKYSFPLSVSGGNLPSPPPKRFSLYSAL